MDFKNYVLSEIRSIKNFINILSSNSKKVEELPEQENLDTSSLIHVSRGGVSEKLPLSKIIEAVENNLENRLIECGDINVSGNNVTFEPNISAVINGIIYTRSTFQVINVPFAATGKYRTDIVVFNTSGNLERVIGEETIGIAVRPIVPINTVLVTEISVNDSGFSNTDPVYSTIDTTANHFKGNYDITTNTPVLSNSTGILNDEYLCTSSGTRDFGAGNITVGINDILSFNGTNWFKKVNNNQSIDVSGKQDTLTEVNFGTFANALTTEDDIADSDKFNFTDSSDANKQKKTSWLNIKAKIQTALASVFAPLTRTITINGTTQDLSANRSWTIDVAAKRTYVCDFIISQNIAASPAGNTQWFRRDAATGNNVTSSFTLQTNLDVSTTFATLSNQTPCFVLPFQAKIKSVVARGWTNTTNQTGVDFVVLKSKESGDNVVPSTVSNALIVARELVQIRATGAVNGFNKQFASGSLTTTTLPALSDIRLLFKNLNLASNMFDTIVTVEFEEVL